MCFTRGAIFPHWWHKKRHRARGALICNFLRVRQIGPICRICRTSKKSQIVSVTCDVSFDFFYLKNDVINWFAIFCCARVGDALKHHIDSKKWDFSSSKSPQLAVRLAHGV
jgi:hypothetical protein